MKGLILKDIYCLRTKLLSFVVVSLSTLVLGTLVFVSLEHGNLKDIIGVVDSSLIEQETLDESTDRGTSTEMEASDESGGNVLKNTFVLIFIVSIVLIIPLAIAGDALSCFAMDEKAEFSKILLSLPASPYEMVGARFIVVYGYSFMCYIVSVLTCLIISHFTDLISLMTMLRWSSTFYSVMLVGIGVIMCVFYSAGTRKIEQIATMGALGVVISILAIMVIMSENETINLSKLLETVTNYFNEFYQWLLPVALVLSVFFYYICVKIFKKRKEAVL